MKTLTHDIVPDGDLEIVLKEPNTQQVIPVVRLRQSTTTVQHTPNPVGADEPWAFAMLPTFEGLPQSPIAKEKTAGSDIELRIRVSSAHLIQASPVIRTMLQGPWREASLPSTHSSTSSTPSTSSIREIAATGWNAHALVTVLNIIHSRDEVPVTINLTFFTHIAIIADYYQCRRALRLATQLWWATTTKVSTLLYGNQSVMWLYIAWVFSWPRMFTLMSRQAMEYGEGLELVETNDLPIATILDKLDEKRTESINEILTALDHLATELTTMEHPCGHKCSSMLLGAIMREKHKISQLDPPLTSPFTGHTVAAIITMVYSFRDTGWWECHTSFKGEKNMVHSCTLLKRLKPVIEKIQTEMQQLKLADFQRQEGA